MGVMAQAVTFAVAALALAAGSFLAFVRYQLRPRRARPDPASTGLPVEAVVISSSSGASLAGNPVARDTVAFGSVATFARDDGRRQTFRIVGEDEADPRAGSISYVSPVARALIGKAAGDRVVLGDHEIEVLAVE